MSGYKRVNYYELCRLCTSSQPKDKIHIFRDEGRKLQLQQKIQSCFPLLVCEHDYLPKVVCSTCVQALEQCYTFRQNSINSETMLSSYFANFRFTDDFKKAGKVYVKDTGQKHDVIVNQSNSNSKKVIQVPTTPQPNINLLSETNQPYFTVELPPNKVSDNYPKLQNSNTVQNGVINPPKPEFNIQNIHISKPEDIKYIKPTNDLLNLNYQPNNYLKNGYEPKINNNLDTTTDFSNIMKSNAIQPIMVVDMEQLIESGLPENDVNKLKEVLMKPPPPTTPPEFNNKKIKSDPEQINNNNNDIIKESSKSFKCEICDKNFKRREHLYQHAKLHSGVRPFNCIHCPKTFSRKEHLMRHLTSHSGVKDFSCDVCSKKFSRPDNLKKHKKTHQKSGPFVCEICQKSFVIKHYYVVHKLQH